MLRLKTALWIVCLLFSPLPCFAQELSGDAALFPAANSAHRVNGAEAALRVDPVLLNALTVPI
jgi:hypothetical protein